MKVLLRRNVPGLGKISEVVDVKAGYARNYLLPQRLAVEPTKTNTRKVEAEKQAYLEELARLRAQIEARAKLVDGKEITIAARANQEGQLYGSVGPAQIVAALAEKGLHVEPENVALGEPIRKLDKYDVDLKFGEGIAAKIVLWVVPIREDGTVGETVAAPAEPETPAEGEDA
jgi:large subunit ribosomal protein L9